MSQPPRDARWSEGLDPELPSELSELLRSGRAPLGAADEVSELAARLSALLGPASGLAGGGQAAPTAGTRAGGGAGGAQLGAASRSLWAIAGAGAAIALGAAAWLVTTGPAEPSSEGSLEPVAASTSTSVDAAPGAALAPAASAAAADGAPSSPPQPAPSAPMNEANDAKDAEPAPGRSEPAASARRAAPRAAAPARAKRQGIAETTLLEQARAALQRRPAEALELTRQHEARFPEGVLAQEREVIAIEALERLGRKQAASARAAQFERRYRGSVHQPRLLRGGDTSAPAGGALNTAPR